MTAALTHSTILDTGHTPEEWAQIIAGRGMDISPRTIRERANALGACHKLGRAMIITPDQLDMILREGQPCRSKPMPEARLGGHGAGSNSTVVPLPATTGAARAHLMKQVQKTGQGPKKTGRSGVTLLATKHP